MSNAVRITGISAIALAIAFNVPFTILSMIFQYPDILRLAAGQVLDRFHAGGPGLVLTWYAFMLSALAMAPVAVALSVHARGAGPHPVLRQMVLLGGVSAGLLQAIGLSRWVFAIPPLAALHASPSSIDTQKQSAEVIFDMLNNWGGIAIGEHLGQLMTVLFIASLSLLQVQASGRLQKGAALTGFVAAIAVLAGMGEGLAIALGERGDIFGAFTVTGYLALTLWLILTGATLLAGSPSAAKS